MTNSLSVILSFCPKNVMYVCQSKECYVSLSVQRIICLFVCLSKECYSVCLSYKQYLWLSVQRQIDLTVCPRVLYLSVCPKNVMSNICPKNVMSVCLSKECYICQSQKCYVSLSVQRLLCQSVCPKNVMSICLSKEYFCLCVCTKNIISVPIHLCLSQEYYVCPKNVIFVCPKNVMSVCMSQKCYVWYLFKECYVCLSVPRIFCLSVCSKNVMSVCLFQKYYVWYLSIQCYVCLSVPSRCESLCCKDRRPIFVNLPQLIIIYSIVYCKIQYTWHFGKMWFAQLLFEINFSNIFCKIGALLKIDLICVNLEEEEHNILNIWQLLNT